MFVFVFACSLSQKSNWFRSWLSMVWALYVDMTGSFSVPWWRYRSPTTSALFALVARCSFWLCYFLLVGSLGLGCLNVLPYLTFISVCVSMWYCYLERISLPSPWSPFEFLHFPLVVILSSVLLIPMVPPNSENSDSVWIIISFFKQTWIMFILLTRYWNGYEYFYGTDTDINVFL